MDTSIGLFVMQTRQELGPQTLHPAIVSFISHISTQPSYLTRPLIRVGADFIYDNK